MSHEQEATLAGLETALKMEEDGKEFYLKAAKANWNQLGKKLMEQLAAEEDIHRDVFLTIYKEIKTKQKWPDTKYKPVDNTKLKTIFRKAIENADKGFMAMPEAIDAFKTAINMENKTVDFYQERRDKASYQGEQQLYEKLVMQERGHSLVLQDYLEFLVDPVSYYTRTEHLSVDGG
jgi:rubrerythrin